MEFLEDIEIDNVFYQVKGDKVIVDDSFGHAFGIQKGFHFEVENLHILSAYDNCGDCIEITEDTRELLKEVLEGMFNES